MPKKFYFCRLKISNPAVTIQFMKKIISVLALAFVFASCNKQLDDAMKSADKDVILKAADAMYAKKKWKEALSLYERASKLVAGTDDVANVIFNSAYAEYYDKNYKLAGHHFKKFAVTFPQDARAEEASYMSAMSYYKDTHDYNLDQTSNDLAINELQDFLNNYPNSERSKNIREMIEELSYKAEFKAYENARQYFRMGEYKASNVTFENVLNDFPGTKLRPQIYDYIMKSRYELAMNSIYDLKQERLDNAIAYSKFVEKEIPDTNYAKNAANLREKLTAENERFQKIKVQVEEQRAKIAAKQKAEQERQEARTAKKKKSEKDASISTAGGEQVRKDSAAANTPPPAVTLPIQK